MYTLRPLISHAIRSSGSHHILQLYALSGQSTALT
jgi:hypothetical protein